MRQIVAQISLGISNAIHYQESQHRVKERTALAEIGRASTHETDLDSILLIVNGALSNLMKFDHLGTILTEQREKKATVVSWLKMRALEYHKKIKNSYSWPVSGPVIDPVVEEERAVLAQRSRLYSDTDWEDIGETA